MKGKTILLADNSDVFRRMCSNALSEAGFETVIARSGTETIQQLSSFDPKINLMILDLNIPKINGFEVLEWVKNNYPEGTLPVLVIAESCEFGSIMKNLKHLGAAGLTTRSITSEHLVYRVNNFLFNENFSKRIAKRVPTTIQVDIRKGDSVSGGFILNLSETGLFINYAHSDLNNGDILCLTFYLPNDDDAIRAEGKVVWLDRFGGKTDTFFKGFGFHFTKITPEDKEKLAIFVKKELETLG